MIFSKFLEPSFFRFSCVAMAMAAAVETSFSALLTPDSDYELQDSNEEVIKLLLSTVLIFRRPGRHRRLKKPSRSLEPAPRPAVAARAQGRLGRGVADRVSSPTPPAG